jgi:hypothetical protein
MAWWAKKEYGKAVEDFDEAIRLNPEFALEKLREITRTMTNWEREMIKDRYGLGDS